MNLKPIDQLELLPVALALFDGSSKLWHAEIGALLAQAAIISVEHDLDADTFIKGAWSAYVEARPGMHEHLEKLRMLGRMSKA